MLLFIRNFNITLYCSKKSPEIKIRIKVQMSRHEKFYYQHEVAILSDTYKMSKYFACCLYTISLQTYQIK